MKKRQVSFNYQSVVFQSIMIWRTFFSRKGNKNFLICDRCFRLSVFCLKICLYLEIFLKKVSCFIRREVYNMQRELLRERTRCKALEEELENPMNIHRWRKLEVGFLFLYLNIQCNESFPLININASLDNHCCRRAT